MAGMTAIVENTRTRGDELFARAPVKAKTVQTALKHVRASMQGLRWATVCATSTRHYKSAGKVRTSGSAPSALTAWVHALEASPWVLPSFAWQASLTAAYVLPSETFEPGLSLGAAELADDRQAIVCHLDSVGAVRSWLQKVGPCVVEGAWSEEMFEVQRDAETIGAKGNGAYVPHSVALVGVTKGAVRLVNDRGPGWGALGRAWMTDTTLEALLADGGEAWGALPADPTPKKGSAK